MATDDEAAPAAMTEEQRQARLTELAVQFKQGHQSIFQTWNASREHQIETGKVLIEAKGLLRHGEWLPWLHEHCSCSESTANRYMRAARHPELFRAKSVKMMNFAQAQADDELTSDVWKEVTHKRSAVVAKHRERLEKFDPDYFNKKEFPIPPGNRWMKERRKKVEAIEAAGTNEELDELMEYLGDLWPTEVIVVLDRLRLMNDTAKHDWLYLLFEWSWKWIPLKSWVQEHKLEALIEESLEEAYKDDAAGGTKESDESKEEGEPELEAAE